jgi:hypothetical protein
VRDRAASRLWRVLAALPIADQQSRSETLLVVKDGDRVSPLDRLRRAPTTHQFSRHGGGPEPINRASVALHLNRRLDYDCLLNLIRDRQNLGVRRRYPLVLNDARYTGRGPEQVSRIDLRGFDSLEDAQAFCEKNALDVERALHGATRDRLNLKHLDPRPGGEGKKGRLVGRWAQLLGSVLF